MELTPLQQIIFEVLKITRLVEQFYWTGGTLLSYHYLHHRQSFDLDFFSDNPFAHETLEPFIQELKNKLSLKNIPEKKIFDRWEFLIDTGNEQARCEFVHYNHEKKRLAPLSRINDILIDSLPDLAANKTMAYVDRNEIKDLFDVYTLLTQKKFTVLELLSLVERKFGATWGEFLFWSESTKSLKNIDGLRLYLIEQDRTKQDKVLKNVEHFFLDHGRDYLARHLE